MLGSGNPMELLSNLWSWIAMNMHGITGLLVKGEENPLEHPTWLRFLVTTPDHKGLLPSWLPEMVPVTWFVILVLCLTVIIGTRTLTIKRPGRFQFKLRYFIDFLTPIKVISRLRKQNPGKFQLALEFIVTALENFVRGIVGEAEVKTLTPIIGTTFIFILSLSLIGLVPGFISPTANTATTVALALMAFVFVQYMAISRQGFKKYCMHFLGEPIWLAPLMLPLHIIGELARPLSLSIRLFGNIFGEETVVAVLVLIATSILGNFFWIPLQFPMMLFSIFGSLVQSLVFSMLVSIYIAVALAGHEEHH